MTVTEEDFANAQAAGAAVRQHGYATDARYDRKSERVIIRLHTGVELAVPVQLLEGLAGAETPALSEIEITPTGLGLHWPLLDADIYIPGLLDGEFGSRSRVAAELGTQGGKTRSQAKANAARANGRKGGRPAKRRAIQS